MNTPGDSSDEHELDSVRAELLQNPDRVEGHHRSVTSTSLQLLHLEIEPVEVARVGSRETDALFGREREQVADRGSIDLGTLFSIFFRVAMTAL